MFCAGTSYCNTCLVVSGEGVAALKFIFDVGFKDGLNSEVTVTVRWGNVSDFICVVVCVSCFLASRFLVLRWAKTFATNKLSTAIKIIFFIQFYFCNSFLCYQLQIYYSSSLVSLTSRLSSLFSFLEFRIAIIN